MADDISLRQQNRRRKEAEAEAKQKEARYSLAVQDVMKTASGKIVLREFLSRAHVFQTSYVPADPQGTAYREGERNIGLALLGDMMKADAAVLGEILKDEADKKE